MNNYTSATPSNGVIILQGTNNYLEWLYTIEMAANCGVHNVWQYINPCHTNRERQVIPSSTEKPKPNDVSATATTVSQLSAIEIDDFKLRLADWKEERAEINEIKLIIGTIQNKVLGSISEKLLPQLKGKSTVSEILLYLNKRFRPTDQARKQDVISKWSKVKEKPKDMAIIPWLDQWELIYADAIELCLPHVIEPQAQYDFLYAMQSFAGSWVELKLAKIEEQVISNEPIYDFYDLIESFRHKQRLNDTFSIKSDNIGGSNSSGVFTASEDKKDTVHKGKDQDGQKTCLCGNKHQFENCFYLNFKNTTRPPSFVYKKEIFDKINGKLRPPYMHKLRAFIGKKFGYDPKTTPSIALESSRDSSSGNVSSNVLVGEMGSFVNHYIPDETSSFSVNNSNTYHLYEHWVLDGGSDIHICNKSMLKIFSKTSESTSNHKVVAGSAEYQVEAWGTCKVEVYTPQGKGYILLKRTAYIPNFMTSLVSLSKLVAGGIHWSSRTPNRLENTDGSMFCQLFKSGEHIIFERQEVKSQQESSKNWALNSRNQERNLKNSHRRHKIFTKEQLHRILGHPSPEVVDHIIRAVKDENITIVGGKSPNTLECQTCALSKSHQIISRSSVKEHPETKPFERITIDLIPMREGYNSNTQIIHFQCYKTLFNMIFTMHSKSESSNIVIKVLNLVLSMSYKALEWESPIKLKELTYGILNNDFFENSISSTSNTDVPSLKNIDDQPVKNEDISLNAMDSDRELPRATGNQAKNASLINPNIDEGNIIYSKRTRTKTKKGGHYCQQYYLSFKSSRNGNQNFRT
ncbi:hypothetical protein HI914_05020 [Erysiphe necator]|nr:hypothetical protein HI914_05020 [Erysiphe necator]